MTPAASVHHNQSCVFHINTHVEPSYRVILWLQVAVFALRMA
jgi:hypothetical protein